ncbi:hypothetical protein L3Q82_008018 [Scortum barcoo]|uniref:Uncharacterized protein n=1 Tax=Scortum barcoo TaxID=214431 RepID=A0ACB8WKW7_9TELE|nr:hypothetical protein L3Q82_008018 [Scortum barcoo]
MLNIDRQRERERERERDRKKREREREREVCACRRNAMAPCDHNTSSSGGGGGPFKRRGRHGGASRNRDRRRPAGEAAAAVVMLPERMDGCSLHGAPGARGDVRAPHRETPPAPSDVERRGGQRGIPNARFLSRGMRGVTVVSNRRQAPFTEW